MDFPQRFAAWLHIHPWIATAFLCGVLTALLICLPILPIELPDAVSQLLGAALGAGIAVGGAVWANSSRERQHRATLREIIKKEGGFLKQPMRDLIRYRTPNGGDPIVEIADLVVMLNSLAEASNHFAKTMTSLRPAFELDPQILLKHHELVDLAVQVRDQAEERQRDEEARMRTGEATKGAAILEARPMELLDVLHNILMEKIQRF